MINTVKGPTEMEANHTNFLTTIKEFLYSIGNCKKSITCLHPPKQPHVSHGDVVAYHINLCVPWAFWDGKVFHSLYIRAKNGAKVEDLCEHKDDVLKTFMELKTLILPHMPPPLSIAKTANSPEHLSNTPQGSPKKKPNLGTDGLMSPPSTPGLEPPTSLAITKNIPGNPIHSRGSSPAISPSSPHTHKIGKTGQKSPLPVAKSSAAKSPTTKNPIAKSPAKSPKKMAS
ncbi:uncharacterized protein [Palaemon carinicauda]|uniref:uncharacterized protein n=1 Tax=Palaemon carinicauda TaxID=392227 RepID=UPI0035B572F1